MGSIYSCARQVILWLGEESDESSSAIETLRALAKGVHIDNYGGSMTISSLLDTLAADLDSDSGAIEEMELSWFTIEKLLERPCEHISYLNVTHEVVQLGRYVHMTALNRCFQGLQDFGSFKKWHLLLRLLLWSVLQSFPSNCSGLLLSGYVQGPTDP